MLDREERRRLCGQVMMCGFEGPSVSAELKEIVRELQPMGLILFRRNIEDAQQLAELVRELKALVPARRLVIAIDQEGGRVARIVQGVTRLPPMARLGEAYARNQAHGCALAASVGEILGRELRALGIDLNFAPVLDVATEPQNPVIGDRALATTPEAVAALGACLIDSMQRQGVAACGKHFPGHGDTCTDSHVALPRIEHSLARLRRVEWPPFQRAISHNVSALMTAHIHVATLDDVPATVSPIVIGEWLRRSLGYDGCVFSDDIDMQGLCAHVAPEQMGPRALLAGVDCMLACRSPEAMFAVYRGLRNASEHNSLPAQVLRAAAARTDRLAHAFFRPALPVAQACATLHQWVMAVGHALDALAD